MVKKLLSVIGLMALALGLLPALSAMAAPAATVTLDTTDVFPGADQTVTVTVENDANALTSPNAVIDYVRVTPPALLLDDGCPAIDGWSCTSHRGGFYDFEPTGSPDLQGRLGIVPGGSLDIPFTADIGAPQSADQTQGFVVDISDEGGANGSFDRYDNLDLTVHVLDLVAGSILETSTPVDNTATRGQTIDAQFTATSYARQDITVTPIVDGVPGTPVVLPGIGAAGAAGDAVDTDVAFDYTTTAGRTPRTTSPTVTITLDAGNGSDAGNLTGNFTIQGEPYLLPDLDSVTPDVVRSSRKDGTGAHIGGFDYDFSFDLEKLNIPTVTGVTATFSLQGATTGPFTAASTTLSWDGTPWAENGVVTVEATNVTIDADIDTEPLSGTLVLTGGTDANGHPYSQTIPLPSIVLIDNLAPLIQDFAVDIPSDQLQIKSGDVITFTGDILDPQDSPTLDFTISGTITDKVSLEQSDPFTIHAEPEFTGDSFTVSWTVPDTIAFGGVDGAVPDFSFLAAAASITDVAGNGSDADLTQDIDNADPAAVLAALADGDAADAPPIASGPLAGRYYVEVELANDYVGTNGESLLTGGCNTSTWDLEGATVEGVYYSDGSDCQNGQAGPDDKRIITVFEDLDPDRSYELTYDNGSLLSDALQDGANNTLLQDAIDTITRIAPRNPVFSTLERYDTDADDGSFEQVTVYGDPGANDRIVHLNRGGVAGANGTTAPHVTIGAASNVYEVHVRDGAGNTLYTVAAPEVDEDDQTTIDLPVIDDIASCDSGTGTGVVVGDNCHLTRLVTFYNPFAESGSQFSIEPLQLTIVLDQVVPEITGSSYDGSDAVDVGYNEILAGGRNNNQDWATVQVNPDADQQQDPFLYRPVNSVDNGSDAATRVLSGLMLDDRVGLYGVSFLYNGDDLDLYEDLAGNRTLEDVIVQS
ncbi:MAG: hypothetical protein ABGZ36_24895 [Actinomycetota bacterium]